MTFKKQKRVVEIAKPLKKIMGQFIHKEGDPVTHAYIVASGEIRITKKISQFKPTYVDKPDLVFDDFKQEKKRPKLILKDGGTENHQVELEI
jgi:hypothetical protein